MKTKNIRIVILLVFFVWNGSTAVIFSRDKDAVVRKCNDFELDGKGTSGEWNKAEWITLQQRAEKSVNYDTRVKILYSATGIYFLFSCEDKKLNSDYDADNLDLYEKDVVEVFLWPKEDFPVYFEYELSPLNFELPIMVPNYQGSFFGWLPWHYEGDKKTRHATSVQGGKKENGSEISSWMAEIFIPYKLLQPLPLVPPKSGNRWRANMYRIDYDQGMTPFSWQKTGPSFHDYNHFGTIVFE